MAKLQDSSSAGSSDDIDEVMRRTREKRKLLNKSSETYTPRKKVFYIYLKFQAVCVYSKLWLMHP